MESLVSGRYRLRDWRARCLLAVLGSGVQQRTLTREGEGPGNEKLRQGLAAMEKHCLVTTCNIIMGHKGQTWSHTMDNAPAKCSGSRLLEMPEAPH